MLPEGRYRFEGTLSIEARAPGHDFTARGPAVRGEAQVAGGALQSLEVQVELAELKASDPLGNRELRKFLGLERRPTASASLRAPCPLSSAASAELEVAHNGRRVTRAATARVSAQGFEATMQTAFSDFGYRPPRLLLFKVKDPLRVTVEARLQPA